MKLWAWIKESSKPIREAIKIFYEKKVHFLQLHYFYILVLVFITSTFFYFQPNTHWDYIDALFMATSTVTNTGLNTINMSALSTWQLVAMYLSSFVGSHVMVSIIVIYVRRHYFSIRFEYVLKLDRDRRRKEANQRRFASTVQRNNKEKKGPIKRRLSIMSTQTAQQPKQKRFSLMFNRMRGRSSVSLEQETSEHPNSMTEDDTESSGESSSSLSVSEESSNKMEEESVTQLDTESTGPLDTSIMNRESTNSTMLEDMNAVDTSTLDQESTNPLDTSTLDHESTNPLDTSILNHDANQKPSQKRKGSTVSLPPITSPTQPTLTKTQSAHELNKPNHLSINVEHHSGIAFADNIEQQREIARRRLEHDRHFEEILRNIAGEPSSQVPDTRFDAEAEDEEMKRILREPVDKSELTREQRYRLGGAEYRAIDFLTILVPVYYVFFVIAFGFFIRIYVAASSYAQDVLRTSNPDGPIDTWGFSFFASLSSFNNLGLIPLDASLVPFQSAPCILILCMVLILAGNTAYAIFLRLIIWVLYKVTPKTYKIQRETYRYLLDHPRRCYTTLFPSTQTKWLLIVLLCITAVEFICFVSLNFWLPVLEGVDWGARVLDGLFQSVATRNAGFTVVDLMKLNPGTQIVFIVAMYISVYPVAISMRNSNVYQERALGIYSEQNDNDDDDMEDDDDSPRGHVLKRRPTMSSIVTTSKKVLRKPDFFVMTQIQRQLANEIFWVICCIFAICVIESEAILSPSPITIASIIYECVSAFGNVGASTGYPNTTASQAQQYHTLSKLVLIILMYRGRHRGLPAAIDRAVLLPSEQLEQQEHQDHLLRRRNTTASLDGDSSPILFYTRTPTL